MICNNNQYGVIPGGDRRGEQGAPLLLLSPEEEAQQKLCKANSLKPFDVICGKHKLAFNNVGNRRFRIVIEQNVQRYIDAPNRSAKSRAIHSVVKLFEEELGATFVEQKNGQFVPVSDKIVRSKVGHALRDFAAFHSGRSSNVRTPADAGCFRDAKTRRGSISCSSSSSGNDDSDISENSDQSAHPDGIAERSEHLVVRSSIATPGENRDHANKYCNTSMAMMVGDMVEDDSWADDLSIGSTDRPVQRNDIFMDDDNFVGKAIVPQPNTSTSANWKNIIFDEEKVASDYCEDEPSNNKQITFDFSTILLQEVEFQYTDF